MTAAAIRLAGVEVSRGGRTVLVVPEVTFPGGRLSLIEGENGAGKTTLLLAAAGLLSLAKGQVWMGDSLYHQGAAPAPLRLRRPTAFSFQDPYFFSGRVHDNLAFGLSCRHVPAPQRIQRIGAMLERLGLGELSRRRARSLSGGEKKLCDLARALVLEPEVLFLDEPTAGLDERASARVEGLLGDLIAAARTTLILATHDVRLAERLSGERLRLREGRPVDVCPADPGRDGTGAQLGRSTSTKT